ncbi:zinc finger protein with KRAB and SCAN domains 7-like isoform X2 [Mya arenaria]|uniref:zinc finger protein with KRAB and SCAN domains 7-like isoform X2 n=1 Tax=Mya arenaria TaxID=6604 RepID=UPI0022E118A3|nr:zinc finger protein with KRAB and SCAN domains 7-like isoform X2 [Mya arenaria]
MQQVCSKQGEKMSFLVNVAEGHADACLSEDNIYQITSLYYLADTDSLEQHTNAEAEQEQSTSEIAEVQNAVFNILPTDHVVAVNQSSENAGMVSEQICVTEYPLQCIEVEETPTSLQHFAEAHRVEDVLPNQDDVMPQSTQWLEYSSDILLDHSYTSTNHSSKNKCVPASLTLESRSLEQVEMDSAVHVSDWTDVTSNKPRQFDEMKTYSFDAKSDVSADAKKITECTERDMLSEANLIVPGTVLTTDYKDTLGIENEDRVKSKISGDRLMHTTSLENDQTFINVETLGFQEVSLIDKESHIESEFILQENEEGSNKPKNAVKGGRRDPENPYAVTSPIFRDSAGKAILTTVHDTTGTTVTISIMSIGSSEKLIPGIVSSDAAQGGVIRLASSPRKPCSIRVLHKNTKPSNGNLRHDSSSEIDEPLSEGLTVLDKTTIERLDVEVQVDDTQCVNEGKSKSWQCKLCSKSYRTKHNLVTHILEHGGIKPHLCLVCGKYFRQLYHLNIHLLQHDHLMPYSCEVCERKFTQQAHLVRHRLTHTESQANFCEICCRNFSSELALHAHKEKHDVQQCVVCGETFTSKKRLADHMEMHGAFPDLDCDKCDLTFENHQKQVDHMMSVHNTRRPWTCQKCGMNFPKEGQLRAHLFTHTGSHPYTCPYCDRSFNQKANMMRHSLVHSKRRNFCCKFCAKTFTQPQILKTHLLTHSKEKPFKCEICKNFLRHKRNIHKLGEMEEDAVDFLTGRSHAGCLNNTENLDPGNPLDGPAPGYNMDGTQLWCSPRKHRRRRKARSMRSKRNDGTITITN